MRARVALASLALGACGDAALTYPAFVEAYERASCTWLTRCGLAPDVDRCLRLRPEPHVYPDLAAAITTDLVRWDPAAAAACVAWVADLTCDPTTPAYRRPNCRGLVAGTLHDGEACAFGAECISGECWMEGAACEGEVCCRGTCIGDEPPVDGTVGDRCRFSACVDSFCEDSMCRTLLPAGAACTSDRQCAYGLSCTAGACAVLPGPGEPCTGACRDVGQICDWRDGRCRPAGLAGAACLSGADCAPYHACDPSTNRCEERVAHAVGERCETDDQCAAPAVCIGAAATMTATCQPPLADGAACTDDRECASGRCDGLGACSSEPCL